MDFLDKNFLLHGDTARKLYHETAAALPIIDYHCHLNPAEIAENRRFENITQAWLGGDHYKWRMMRIAGVEEKYITGEADDFEKFLKWSEVLSGLIGNPLYHWTHLELRRYFGTNLPLNPKTAAEIYEICNKKLAEEDMNARGLMIKSNVEAVCTTDDPCDSLEHHGALKNFSVKVLPTFRPDRAVDIERDDFTQYITGLEKVCGGKIDGVDSLLRALESRMEHFAKAGCKLSDHAFEKMPGISCSRAQADGFFKSRLSGAPLGAVETEMYKTFMIGELGGMICDRGWTMQLHIGAMRNNNTAMFEKLGRDTGYDTMADHALARQLSLFLDGLEKQGRLPKTIIYTLNPKDNYVIAALTGAFAGGVPGKIQFGSAWWFADHLEGMKTQMRDLASLGYLAGFIGMLTDSRSFLSYTRHEYFRRILCGFIGDMVDRGEFYNDEITLNNIVRGICYENAKKYLNF